MKEMSKKKKSGRNKRSAHFVKPIVESGELTVTEHGAVSLI